MTGVFLTRGMTVAIPPGGLTLSIGADGKPHGRLTIQVHYDLCPTWLELASRHLSDAEERKLARTAAWNTDDQDAKAASLEAGFESSMQAIMAAAIAIDSFYAALRDKTDIPPETIKAWRENKTARYKQIVEVLRRAFSIAPRNCINLRKNLTEIFKARDMAIHPSSAVAAPVLHPELQVDVEWRFAWFRADNAKDVVEEAQSIVRELLAKGKPSTPEIHRYIDGLRNLITAQAVTKEEGQTDVRAEAGFP
ncbi:MAG: hypothetical protein ACREFJ_11710 [Acetobacteraceae bacterium]